MALQGQQQVGAPNRDWVNYEALHNQVMRPFTENLPTAVVLGVGIAALGAPTLGGVLLVGGIAMNVTVGAVGLGMEHGLRALNNTVNAVQDYFREQQ